MLLCDPPDGWRFGFPRPFDLAEGETLEAWLVRSGYPPKAAVANAKYCRFIGSSEDLAAQKELGFGYSKSTDI